MALDKLLTFTEYYNQLKTLDDLRIKWLSFMERLKAVQDNLPEGTYLNAPYNISDTMIQIMSTSLDTVLPSGTNVVKKIYNKDLGIIKYDGNLYVGFPDSDLNDYLSGKTSTELSRRRVILLQGNNGCIGCCVRFINEFTPPQFSSGNYDILKCGGDSTSWIYNYRWFEMEALGNLATDGMVDLVSTNNISINASDPNAIFYPTQQIDVVSSIHSCYGKDIPKEVNFNKTRFCMDNSISSSSFAVKTKPNETSNGRIIFTASKIGSSFIITVKPRLEEWKWAYSILGLLGRFAILEYAGTSCGDNKCTRYYGKYFDVGQCVETPSYICSHDKSCDYLSSIGNNSRTNFTIGPSTVNPPLTDSCGRTILEVHGSGGCVSSCRGIGKYLCDNLPPITCTNTNPPGTCMSASLHKGIGCQIINIYDPLKVVDIQTCSAASNTCSTVRTYPPKTTLSRDEVVSPGVGDQKTLDILSGIYSLSTFFPIINHMCVHSAFNMINVATSWLNKINTPSTLTRGSPFPSDFKLCSLDDINNSGVVLSYESWGEVYNTCDCVDSSTTEEANCKNVAEIDSCGLMHVHIGNTTTWTFYP